MPTSKCPDYDQKRPGFFIPRSLTTWIFIILLLLVFIRMFWRNTTLTVIIYIVFFIWLCALIIHTILVHRDTKGAYWGNRMGICLVYP